MDLDDLLPKKKPTGVAIGDSLETLSVGELEKRVKDLETEILRVRTEIDRKKRHEEKRRARFSSREGKSKNEFQIRCRPSDYGIGPIRARRITS